MHMIRSRVGGTTLRRRAAMHFTIDIEATNRCNARCEFCPRDRTPHQGLLHPDVFAQALVRACEFRARATTHFEDVEVSMTFCGLGEPLLHPQTPAFVHMASDAGFRCGISTNASMLDQETAQALLEAKLEW